MPFASDAARRQLAPLELTALVVEGLTVVVVQLEFALADSVVPGDERRALLRTRLPARRDRRMIAVTAASAAALLPGGALAQPRHAVWRGVALGAETQIQLAHPDEHLAREILKKCIGEVRRLEAMFSLYQSDSSLSRLNRDGKLSDPAFEFIELIAAAHQISEETEGTFDVSVQPLWTLYADHFARPEADPLGPGEKQVRQALDLIDYRAIKLSSGQVTLTRKGMALTLNGIAQGFITDRIAALLRRNGFHDVLVHLGETYAGGTKADGKPWRAGIAAPDASAAFASLVELKNRALATSAPGGHPFSGDGRHHHLFDPRSGLSVTPYHSVSVSSPSAMTADALSTAYSVMPLSDIRRIMAHRPDEHVMVIGLDDQITEI